MKTMDIVSIYKQLSVKDKVRFEVESCERELFIYALEGIVLDKRIVDCVVAFRKSAFDTIDNNRYVNTTKFDEDINTIFYNKYGHIIEILALHGIGFLMDGDIAKKDVVSWRNGSRPVVAQYARWRIKRILDLAAGEGIV